MKIPQNLPIISHLSAPQNKLAVVGAVAVIAVASGVAAGYAAQSLYAPSVASVRTTVARAPIVNNLAQATPAAVAFASASEG